MLLIVSLSVMLILAIYACWYMKKFHKEWWFWCDTYLIILSIMTALVLFAMCLTAVIIQCSPGDTNTAELLDSRHKIIAEINSDDPVIHNSGIDDAIVYNREVKYGKDQLNNLWSNWFTSRLWADAEFIEVDTDSYVIIPETKE